MTGERSPGTEPDPSDIVEGEIGTGSDIVKGEIGDASDVVDGEIGEARLRSPGEIEQAEAGADLEALGVTGPDDPLQPTDESEQTEMDRHREAGLNQ